MTRAGLYASADAASEKAVPSPPRVDERRQRFVDSLPLGSREPRSRHYLLLF